ncbi:MAG: DUF4184 family protein [Fibrobacter sp.]|nr:DUF4184 family protein [Fibrobacter sp.]
MPITISHPAAAIPFRCFDLVLSALIVGSMIPDFEFFLKLSDGKVIGHTIPGIFLFCIPLGLTVLFVFHKLIKFPLLSLLPYKHQAKLYPFAKKFHFFPARRFIHIILSLFTGIASHLIWDSFTHHDGFMVKLFPFLSNTVFSFPQGDIRLYFILQYAGSVLGLIMIIYWYRKWFYHAKPVDNFVPYKFHLPHKFKILSAILFFSASGGLTFGYFTFDGKNSTELIKSFITQSSIASFSGFLFALLIFGIMWHYFLPHNKKSIDIKNEI